MIVIAFRRSQSKIAKTIRGLSISGMETYIRTILTSIFVNGVAMCVIGTRLLERFDNGDVWQLQV